MHSFESTMQGIHCRNSFKLWSSDHTVIVSLAHKPVAGLALGPLLDNMLLGLGLTLGGPKGLLNPGSIVHFEDAEDCGSNGESAPTSLSSDVAVDAPLPTSSPSSSGVGVGAGSTSPLPSGAGAVSCSTSPPFTCPSSSNSGCDRESGWPSPPPSPVPVPLPSPTESEPCEESTSAFTSSAAGASGSDLVVNLGGQPVAAANH
ncbi:hypothetical protein BT96DRAFT_287500 [Gymnopus androsaceus JB14]|uniref:Uncharacterized protein n=1 Tax=Gymnopus androsaceus JB14 TaxID=1447944 RepID=A0A6A4H371_9AGAR|nr:hypothetical protein BT96DRAFT_287500 [Gymnopus androsaceus JB14]